MINFVYKSNFITFPPIFSTNTFNCNIRFNYYWCYVSQVTLVPQFLSITKISLQVGFQALKIDF